MAALIGNHICSFAANLQNTQTPMTKWVFKMLLCRTSFCLFVWKFSWDWVINLFQTQHDVKGPFGVVCERARFSFLPPKGRKWSKNRFFEFTGKFVINFLWIWSTKKVCHLLYSCTIPILRKNLIPGKWPTCSGLISRIFKLIISLELNYEKAWLFACSCRLMEIKILLKKWGWAPYKMYVATLVWGH